MTKQERMLVRFFQDLGNEARNHEGLMGDPYIADEANGRHHSEERALPSRSTMWSDVRSIYYGFRERLAVATPSERLAAGVAEVGIFAAGAATAGAIISRHRSN